MDFFAFVKIYCTEEIASQVITSKKIPKLAPGDEIGFGERGRRIRGIILLIGELVFLS